VAKKAEPEGSTESAGGIEFPCGRCSKPVLANIEHVGRRGRCPHCDSPLIVPFVRLPSDLSATEAPAPPGGPTDSGARVVPKGDIDRRQAIRFAIEDCTLRLARSGGHLSPHSYPVRDMSRSGIAFLVGEVPGAGAGIEVGEEVFMSVDVQAFREPLELSGAVKRVVAEGKGTFVVGAEFAKMHAMDRDRIGRLEESEGLRNKIRGHGA